MYAHTQQVVECRECLNPGFPTHEGEYGPSEFYCNDHWPQEKVEKTFSPVWRTLAQRALRLLRESGSLEVRPQTVLTSALELERYERFLRSEDPSDINRLLALVESATEEAFRRSPLPMKVKVTFESNDLLALIAALEKYLAAI